MGVSPQLFSVRISCRLLYYESRTWQQQIILIKPLLRLFSQYFLPQPYFNIAIIKVFGTCNILNRFTEISKAILSYGDIIKVLILSHCEKYG